MEASPSHDGNFLPLVQNKRLGKNFREGSGGKRRRIESFWFDPFTLNLLLDRFFFLLSLSGLGKVELGFATGFDRFSYPTKIPG